MTGIGIVERRIAQFGLKRFGISRDFNEDIPYFLLTMLAVAHHLGNHPMERQDSPLIDAVDPERNFSTMAL